MSERIHALAQRLFGKAGIEECRLEEIQELVNRYPYFAPAQFLLLEKLKQEGSEEYQRQLQKSILYYHNPLGFQYFISSERFYTDDSFINEEEQPLIPGKNEIFISEENLDTPRAVEEVNEAETGLESSEEINDAEDVHYPYGSEIFSESVEESTEEVNEPISDTGIETTGEQPIIKENVEDEFQGEYINPGTNPKPMVEETQVTPAAETELNTPLQIPSLKVELPVNENQVTFEPFHTVDYFASQGIKLSQEEMPKDKFGKQLKSFTEWLKTMKRLPATQITAAVDNNTETKVQHLAEDSIHESDVWTEAMAEVWEKQGNKQKAIETYNKLSLLNPSKKPYFAAKIENLKRS